MVMGSDRHDAQRAKEILFHEYIHHLTFEHSPNFTYSRWYIEGLAELLDSTKVERNSVVVEGRPTLENALDYYGVLRLTDVLQNRRPGERSEVFESRFYGAAWLLTHYVQIHALANDPDPGRKNRAYLTRYNQGDDSIRAFEEVLKRRWKSLIDCSPVIQSNGAYQF